MTATSLSQTIFASLVARAGGVDPAAAILTAAKGKTVDRATVSRMASGVTNVSAESIWAMEDHLGVYPMTDYRTQTRQAQSNAAAVSIFDHLRATIKETSEALSALTDVANGGCKTRAVVELGEAIAELQAARSTLEKDGDEGSGGNK